MTASIGATIKAVTVSELLHSVDYIDILKLEIEGAEKEVFSGDLSWLDRVRLIIIELHERYVPGCTQTFLSAMSTYNFKKISEKGENVFFEKVMPSSIK